MTTDETIKTTLKQAETESIVITPIVPAIFSKLDEKTQLQIKDLKTKLTEAKSDKYLQERPVELEIEIKDIWRGFLKNCNDANFLSDKADFAIEMLESFDEFERKA